MFTVLVVAQGLQCEYLSRVRLLKNFGMSSYHTTVKVRRVAIWQFGKNTHEDFTTRVIEIKSFYVFQHRERTTLPSFTLTRQRFWMVAQRIGKLFRIRLSFQFLNLTSTFPSCIPTCLACSLALNNLQHRAIPTEQNVVGCTR